MKAPSIPPMQSSQFKRAVTGTIGEQIRFLRRKKGLSGSEFGALMGMSQQQISRYERGINYITVDILLLMLSHFEVSPELFFRYLTLRLKKQGLLRLPVYSFYDNEIQPIHNSYHVSLS